MIKSIYKLAVPLLLLATTGPWPGTARERDTLRVGVFPDPPFIIREEVQAYSGLCIDLWEEIAMELELAYKYVEFNDLIGMIRALDYKEIDVSINPLSVSSTRLKMFEVSQPFYISSIGVATTMQTRSQFSMFLGNFFSTDFLKVVLLLLLIIFVFGTLLWAVEHRYNKFQFRPGLRGLLDGLWWSAVTMTTVGYGDKAPKTTVGKTIAIIWMFTAVIIISSFTATIASTLTVNSLAAKIERLEDLQTTERIGTVGATSGEDFLVSHDILPTETYETPLTALRELARGEVDVVVYDKTVMRYLINQEQLDGKIQLLPVTFNKQYRSFLLPKGSPLHQAINPLLVSRINRVSWQDVLQRYNLEEED
jgi:polar amino acid transport system substrate-binding protein